MRDGYAWAKDPFRDFVKYAEDVRRLVDVSTKGVIALLAIPNTALLLNSTQDPKRNTPEDIEKLEALAALAKQEQDAGFPMMYAHATISIWTALETLTKEFAVAWLANEPSAMKVDAVKKIKISVTDYQEMTEAERYYYIYENLERELSAPLKQGITRFETILKALDIGGNVDETVRDTLYELSNIRNVLIHRNSVADKRLVDACPWLSLSVGDRVIITPERFRRYMIASIDYVTAVSLRVTDYLVKRLPLDTKLMAECDGTNVGNV